MDLRTALEGRIPEEARKRVYRSFDIIGDIAIVQIPEEILEYKHEIGRAILDVHKHVRLVLLKKGDIEGEYRVGEYEIIAGEGPTETIHKESGCRFLLDPTRVYYSERLGSERERVANMVTEGEKILCMYAGVGPFPIVIARKNPSVRIVGVELNPVAVEYFRKNVELNRVGDRVEVVEGDVAVVVPQLDGVFDRVLMPAPKNAPDHLHIALEKTRKGGMLHYYYFSHENETEQKKRETLEKIKSLGREPILLGERKCGQVGSRQYRMVLDLKID